MNDKEDKQMVKMMINEFDKDDDQMMMNDNDKDDDPKCSIKEIAQLN